MKKDRVKRVLWIVAGLIWASAVAYFWVTRGF